MNGGHALEQAPQRLASVELDRIHRRLGAEDLCGVLLGEVDGRCDQVRRMRMRELDHPLAEVGLHHLHAQVFEVVVEPDLLAGHRLALGHDHSLSRRKLVTCVPADLADDVARLGGVLGDVDDAADRGQALRELLEELGQAVEVRLAPALEVGAALGEVEGLERGVAPAAEPGHGADQRLLQLGVVEGAVHAPREVITSFCQAGALRAPGARACEASLIASLTASGVDTGAKHICPEHTTARWSPSGSMTAYGWAARAARASSGFLVVTLTACARRSSARAKTAAMRP